MRSALSATALLALLACGGAARGQTTDLLLVLAADVSRSIDESEFALQRKGYSAAVTDPRVLAAIRGGARGSIAICFVEWSSEYCRRLDSNPRRGGRRWARGRNPCCTPLVYWAHLDQRGD